MTDTVHDSARRLRRLEQENESLRARLEEAEQTLAAIQQGQVDALVVDTPEGQRIFTLEGAERPYRLLIEQMQEGAATLGPDGEIRYANWRLAEMLKRPLEEVIGSLLEDNVVEADVALVRTLRNQAVDTHARGQVVLRAGDGSLVPAHLALSPIEDGEPGVAVVVADLTERRRIEAISASEERFRLIAENAPELIFLVDAFGRYAYASAAFERLLGHQPKALLGQDAVVLVHPDDVSALHFSLCGGRFQVRMRHAEGHWRSFDGSCHPVQQGNLAYVLCLAHDVTEQQRAAAALFEANERLEALLRGLPVGVTFCDDATCERIIANPAALAQFEIGPDDNMSASAKDPAARGRQVRYFADGHELGATELPLQRAVAENREVPPLELEVHLPSGRKWIAMASAAPLHDKRGRVGGGVAVTVDITDRKKLEQQRDALLDSERVARGEAERASKAKDEFLATISHELRTPLGAVLGWAQMLQRGRLDEHEAREAVDTIERNARLQKELIDDLLDMGRIISGKLKFDLQPVEIVVLVREAVGAFRPEAERKGVRLDELSRVESVQVLADPGRLKQVISNLLSNAIKFTPAGGRVRVVVAARGEQVLITVKDTGIGIRPEFLPQLFERFRQADATITRKYRGLGLGLAIVKQLVALHGGTVRARSRGEGRGATFTVGLPRMAGWTAAEVPSDAAWPASAVDLRGIRALVVDDEPATLALIARILADAGAEVVRCDGAPEALRAIAADDFAILVSDISMPGEDGYTLLQKVRALPDATRAYIPAIALTAFVRDEDRRRAFEAGYQAHVTKPVDAAELPALVANLARRPRAAR